MKIKWSWVFRICLFLSVLMIGRSIGQRFLRDQEPTARATTSAVSIRRTLVIVVNSIKSKPEILSGWLIGSGLNVPTHLLQLFPSIDSESESGRQIPLIAKRIDEDDFVATFALEGFWSSQHLSNAFQKFLHKQGIFWDDYIVIDEVLEDAIAHAVGIDQESQPFQEIKLSSPKAFQSRLWNAICNQAAQTAGGLDFAVASLNKSLHMVQSSPSQNLVIIPASPSFPTCFGNYTNQPVSGEESNQPAPTVIQEPNINRSQFLP